MRVGILVAVAAAVLIFGIFAVTGGFNWFSPKLTLTTYVEDAGGMRAGASVNLEGVVIGNVTRIHLAEHPPDPQKPVEIAMQVSGNHQRWLRTDSKVMLGTAGPLGETLVNIDAGTLAAPPATSGTVLQGEESTGINQLLVSTHSVIDNANLLETRIGGLLDQIQNGKGSVGKLLYSEELYDRFNSIATNLQDLTHNLNAGKGTAGKLLTSDELYTKLNTTLDNVNSFLNAAQHGNGSMAKLLNDPTLYNNANSLMRSVQHTTDALNNGQGAIGALLTDSPTSAHLKDSLDKLNGLLSDLQAGKGTAGKLLKDDTLYANLNNITTETQALIKAIRTDPKKYLTIHLNIF